MALQLLEHKLEQYGDFFYEFAQECGHYRRYPVSRSTLKMCTVKNFAWTHTSDSRFESPTVTPVISSGEFLQRVDLAIKGSPHLVGHHVSCEHQQGTVILHGTVNSFYQKQMAQEALRNLDGVQRIVNLLEVHWDNCSTLATSQY